MARSIGKTIGAALKAKGLSLRAAAIIAGLSHGAVVKLVSDGSNELSVTTLRLLCAVAGLDPGDVLSVLPPVKLNPVPNMRRGRPRKDE